MKKYKALLLIAVFFTMIISAQTAYPADSSSNAYFNSKAAALPFDAAAGGPAPVFTELPQQKVFEARLNLKNLRPDEKLSSNDCNTILQYAMQNIRTALFNSSSDMLSKHVTIEEFFTPDVIAGFCELAEAATIFILDDLSINRKFMFRGQSTKLFGKRACRHAFVVVQMPDEKYYLIDPTFRQFFHQQQTASNEIGFAGRLLLKQPKGIEFAEKLLKHGYIEFNDEYANIYGIALSRCSEMNPPSFNLSYILKNNEGPYYMTRFIFSEGNIPVIPQMPESKQVNTKELRNRRFSEKVLND